jgi:hypothetical protein
MGYCLSITSWERYSRYFISLSIVLRSFIDEALPLWREEEGSCSQDPEPYFWLVLLLIVGSWWISMM